MMIQIATILARFANKIPIIAAGITLAAALIVITPLCGYLFQCGCTWPWAGLDSNCNIRDPAAPYHCPWCASTLSGWLSTILAVTAGCVTTFVSLPSLNAGGLFKTPLRVLFGMAVFCIVAVIAAGISASQQNYPLGVFSIFLNGY
ncbi:MAG: hypothetical protein ACU85E_00090 [Gammaproteobacteria bacterium]